MKNLTTRKRIKSDFRLYLLGVFIVAIGVIPAVSQTVINSGLKFGENNLNAEGEAMLQEYLEDYSVLTELGNGYPPIWDNPVPQDKPHGIIVALEANPRINDIPLEQYDYIGGFYTDDNGELRCGGAGYWPDTAGIVFALQKDNPDTPEKDGFSFMETIYIKVFTFSTMKDYDVDVYEFDPEFYGTNKWGALGLSRFLDMQALEDLDFYIAPSGNPICIGNELTLSAEEFIGSNGNYSFQWSSNPPGFSYNTQFPPSVTPSESTVYTLVVQDGSFVSEHSLSVQVEEFPEAFAGDDGQVCANEAFPLVGQAQFYSALEWTTSGDGFFDDPYLLNAQYHPGPTDAANGQVSLSLAALPLNPCDLQASDNMTLTVLPLPGVDAGEDFVGCTTEDVEVSADISNYSTVEWTTSGSGTFLDPTAVTTQYIASGNDFQNGVTFYICVEAQNPCSASICDTVHVDYVPGPTAYGMTSSTGCENNYITVSGIAYNYSTTEWTTVGDGTFENPALFSTKYFPGTQDIENGGTTVTLNAYPVGNCDVAAKDVMINVVRLPVITFGPNSENICSGDEFMQLDITVEHSNSVVWSTNGDGTFSGTHVVNPKYYPGPQDEQNGQFELELLAYPLPYCATSTIETLSVVYQDDPVADAGEDGSVCHNEGYLLSGSAQNNDGFSWNTTGDGTFDDVSSANATYYPGDDDIENGVVELTLSALPIGPCLVADQDAVVLNISHCQDLLLDAGWSGVSSWVDPLDASPEVLFDKILDDLVIIQSQSGVFWPGQNINTMGNWNSLEGYSVKMDETAEITITGARSASNSLDLANGWSMIPVLSECLVDVESLFNGTDLMFVKEIVGWRVYWPDMGVNNLGNLQPGMAYQVMMNTQGTINFPECAQQTKAEHQKPAPSILETIDDMPWNHFNTSPNTHIIGVPQIAVAENQLKHGDLLGAFDASGNCYGVIVWKGSNTNITVYGDDPVTLEKDGFVDGEPITFRLFAADTREESELLADFDAGLPQYDGMFHSNGISMIKALKSVTSGIATATMNNIRIYPNPTTGLLNVVLDGVGLQQVEISLVNAGGQVLMNEDMLNAGQLTFNIANHPKGVYYLKIVAGEVVQVEKIVLK